VDYLLKPYDSDELLKRVHRACAASENHLSKGAESSEILDEPPNSQWRLLHLETMRIALRYWEWTMRKPKSELARSSGIWSYYVDKEGSVRSKTLDRYLQEATLPKKPQTRLVINTAQYVLENCPVEKQLRPHLEANLKKLMSHLLAGA